MENRADGGDAGRLCLGFSVPPRGQRGYQLNPDAVRAEGVLVIASWELEQDQLGVITGGHHADQAGDDRCDRGTPGRRNV